MIFTPSVTERDGQTGLPAAGGGDAGFILGALEGFPSENRRGLASLVAGESLP